MNSKITQRYAESVHSKNLRSKAATNMSDSDMLGAAGFAGRIDRTESADGKIMKRAGHPLATALARLFAGDDREARHIVCILSEMAWGKARFTGIELKRVQADDMARAVVAWFRHGTCKVCGGHGYKVTAGTLKHGRAVVGDVPCGECRGTRKVNFDRQFSLEHLRLARWLRDRIEREQGVAGAEIMKALGSRIDEL